MTRLAAVDCFPTVDCDTGAVSWPDGVSLFQPGVSFVPDPALPLTMVGVARFATCPEGAGFRVSIGPAGGEQKAFVDLWDYTRRPLSLCEFHRLVTVHADQVVRGDTAAAEELIGVLLDRLEGLEAGADQQTDSAVILDGFLTLLRSWAGFRGFRVLPGGWSFGDRGTAAVLDGLTSKAVFRRDVPAGQIARVKKYGIVHGDRIVRPGEVVVSAGPPPRGLTELETAAVGIPGPEGEAVRSAFRDLRPAGLGGYLELAAIDLYRLYWDRVHPVWAQTNPAGAGAFGRGLGVMLADTFNLTPFVPENYRDHPAGWVLTPPGTRMVSGRVVRLLRPGLVAGDTLRVPARVEVE